ncbi:YceD family protein [Polynucleobacter sp. TUM22923]|jgi:uncharacterized protein|uniref:YceD family protein n=1 Tax=Polynucleobacter sp. TUM22923 TaxID=3022126 RepID=UPI0025738CB7|nr:YceD family protein [Polynucleobacter sp. TUM22923]
MNRNQISPQVELSTDPSALRRVDFCAPVSYKGAGFLEISTMPRLHVEASSVVVGDGFDWNISTHFVDSAIAERSQVLKLDLKGRIHLICQRCLQDCPVNLLERRQFVLVATEEEADAFSMEDDQQESLVASQHFDLLELLEDEILLSLPLIPIHTDSACKAHASSFGDFGETSSKTEKQENPFNILKNMKKNS